jgi:hypothetical protein
MQWTKDIDIEEHLEGDLKLIYEHCGEDVLLALLDKLKGMNLYLSAEPVTEMKKAYIRERFGDLSAKELSVRLDTSMEFVYETIRSEEDTSTDAPLFEQTTSEQ